MTVIVECFKIMLKYERPMTAQELAKLIGNRQTNGSISSTMWPYVKKGYISKIECKWGDRGTMAYSVISIPKSLENQIKSEED